MRPIWSIAADGTRPGEFMVSLSITDKVGTLLFTPRGTGASVGGQPLPAVTLAPEEATDWRVSLADRDSYSAVEARWYDRDAAEEVEEHAGAATGGDCGEGPAGGVMFDYPVDLTPDDGTVLVTFPDVPEAVTFGADVDEALLQAVDALTTALSFYIDNRRPLPAPSAPDGRPTVRPSRLESAKLGLYQAMTERGIRKAELARRLGWHVPKWTGCSISRTPRALSKSKPPPARWIYAWMCA